MSEPLDEEKLQALSRWSASLQADTRAEVAAAGRAIALLVEEVDRLQRLVALARAVDTFSPPEAEPELEPETSAPPEPVPERVLTPEQRSFRERLTSRNVFPMRSKSSGG